MWPRTIAVVVMFLSLLGINDLAIAAPIPERSIAISKKMRGMQIYKVGRETYDDDYLGTDTIHSIIIPKGEKVDLYLDSSIDFPRSDFKAGDLSELCKQSPYFVQQVSFAQCHDEKKIAKCVEILSHQHALEYVSFYNCRISARTLTPLATVKSLKTISIRCPLFEPPFSIGSVLKNSSIEEIYLTQTHLPHLFGELSKIKTLREINIEGIVFDESDFTNISRHKNLSRICLSHVGFKGIKTGGQSNMLNLKGFPNLEDLYIDARNPGNQYIPDFSFLKGLQNLTRLSLYDTGIDEKGLSEVGNVETLEELDLYSEFRLNGADFSGLKPLKRLKRLLIDEVSLPQESEKMLRSMEVEIVAPILAQY